jgi:hypothetical protein
MSNHQRTSTNAQAQSAPTVTEQSVSHTGTRTRSFAINNFRSAPNYQRSLSVSNWQNVRTQYSDGTYSDQPQKLSSVHQHYATNGSTIGSPHPPTNGVVSDTYRGAVTWTPVGL